MGANKVYTAVRDKIQMSGITLMDINFAVSTLMLEIDFFLAPCKGNIIYIDADDIAVK